MNTGNFVDRLTGDINKSFGNLRGDLSRKTKEYQNIKSGTGNKIPKGYQYGQIDQFDPYQKETYKNQFGFLGPDSDLYRLAMGDEEAFQRQEEPAYRDFNSLISGLASRFGTPSGSGQAQLGARRGSGFQNTMTAAGSNFAQDLQSRREALKRQALNDLMGYSNTLLGQRPVDRFLVPPREKQPEQNIWGDVIRAGGSIIGGYLGRPPGAAAGNKAGNAVNNAVTGG